MTGSGSVRDGFGACRSSPSILGTTSTKAVVFAVDGTVLGEGNAGYPLAEPEPGAAVQDPEAVWEAVGDAVSAAVGASGHEGLDAVSFSGAMHGLLGVDDRGDPVGPLLTWADSRAAGVAAAWRSGAVDALALHERTGTPVHAMSPLVKLAWLRRERPSLHAAASRWGGMKEFVLGRALGHGNGGRRVTDASCASGTGLRDLRSRTWDDEALDLAGLTPDALDELVGTAEVVGALTDRVADDWGVPAGTAGRRRGGGRAAREPRARRRAPRRPRLFDRHQRRAPRHRRPARIDPRGRLFCYGLTRGSLGRRRRDHQRRRRPGLGRGDARRRLGRPCSGGRRRPVGRRGLLALPHLLAERAPHWDGGLGGVFLNLQRTHGRGHLVRALLEGVCLQLRLVLDSMREAGRPSTRCAPPAGSPAARSGVACSPTPSGMPVGFPEDHQGSA